jgi:hypothetical protein
VPAGTAQSKGTPAASDLLATAAQHGGGDEREDQEGTSHHGVDRGVRRGGDGRLGTLIPETTGD